MEHVSTYGVAEEDISVMPKKNTLILVEDIPLGLSILLKWNKIYISSNTTILYFINLNSGD
jgi:hypothetical protein